MQLKSCHRGTRGMRYDNCRAKQQTAAYSHVTYDLVNVMRLCEDSLGYLVPCSRLRRRVAGQPSGSDSIESKRNNVKYVAKKSIPPGGSQLKNPVL